MPDSLGATVTDADWTSGYEETTVNRNLGRYATPQGAYDTELVVFISIFGIVGIVLNIAALVILMQKKNRRAATNMHLVTLAVGDILICIFVIPLRIVHEYDVFWWSNTGCLLLVFLKYTPLFVNVNTVVLIAIAVVLPAKFAAFATPRNVKIHLVLVWVASFIEMIFPFAVVKTVRMPVKNYCIIYFHEDSLYYMFTFMVALPLACLAVAYGTIIVAVVRRQRQSRVDVTSASKERKGDGKQESRYGRSDARHVIMCAIVSVLFVLCWMPIFIVMYLRTKLSVQVSTRVDHYAHVVFYLHPVLNPLIYFFVDGRFRSGLVRLFRGERVGEGDISMASATQFETTN